MLNNKERDSIAEAVKSWKYRQNQRHKVLKFLVDHKNMWTKPEALREEYTEIKDSRVVLYDMALRNPDDTPRGLGYYERQRIYPKGYSGKPILEFREDLGYRIRPEYFKAVLQNV